MTTQPQEIFTLDDLLGLSAAERAVVEADQAEQVAAAQPAAPAPAPAPAQPAAQPAPVPDKAAAEAQLAQAAEALRAIQDQYDEGSLTSDAWNAKVAEIVKEQAKAEAQILLAEQADAVVLGQWEQVIGPFMQEKGLTSPAHMAAFDAVLHETDAAYPGLSDHELAQAAYARYFVMANAMGNPLPTAANAPQMATPAPAPAQQQQRPAPFAPPLSLGRVPAHSGNGAMDGEFAAVLAEINSGDAYRGERAMARLTPEQQDRFLQGNY